jgi:hypothetical protein
VTKVKLDDNQIRLLKQADDCRGDGWFCPNKSDGPIVGGLKRRGLLDSRRHDHHQLHIRITPLGVAALHVYGVETRPRKPSKLFDFAEYEVRDGVIRLREFNVIVAEFKPNTAALQLKLAKLFNAHHEASLK